MSMSLMDFLLVAIAATAGAGLLFTALRRFDRSHGANQNAPLEQPAGPIFLFQGDILLDASPGATAMIAPHNDRLSDLDAVLHILAPHFPDLRDALSGPAQGKSQFFGGRDKSLRIDVTRTLDHLRIAVVGDHTAPTSDGDHQAGDVRFSELAMLREITQHSPQLIWQEDKSGKLLWANHAYLAFCDKVQGNDGIGQTTWPNASLFPDLHETPAARGAPVRRVSVALPQQNAEQWFDVTSMRRDDIFLHFAADANAIVRADQERHNFVQTLSKTFAHLSIGLAIFNKRRELATFNPALLDMTQLPVDFLSGRPTVDAVLDRLRESRMLPEPKDYTSWRDQFKAVETAARNDSYCENWNLPDGQTYRVTGRPHPDGAFAFLFEDISAEVSLTRRFRTDIETGQAVLDTLPEAIAVFSSAGTLVMSNIAYSNLWGNSMDGHVQQHELLSEIQIWKSRCTPTKMWADLRAFIHLLGPRKPWSDDAILDDGRHLNCQATPIQGGMTMVKFSLAPAMKPVIRKLTMADPALLVAKR